MKKFKMKEYQVAPLVYGTISGNINGVAFTYSIGKGHLVIEHDFSKSWYIQMNKIPKSLREMEYIFSNVLFDCEIIVKGISGNARLRGNAYFEYYKNTFVGSGGLIINLSQDYGKDNNSTRQDTRSDRIK